MAAEPGNELSLPELPEAGLPDLPERFQPRNLTELMSWSKLVHKSGLAPKDMNEAGIVLAVQMGAELKISPTQALSGICVINGRASIWGDLGKAIFMRDAAYEKWEDRDPADAKAKGEGWCRITMKDGRVIERRYTREMATEAKAYERAKGYGPWATNEGDMLQWRATWKAMRHADPRVFKGMTSAEEMSDVIEAQDVKVDGAPLPRRRSEGVPIGPEMDSFLKTSGTPAGPSQQPQGERSPAMPGKPPSDRSKLQKVLILDTAEKQGGGRTFYVVNVQPSSGPKIETTTFSKTDYETATNAKGHHCLIDTKAVTKQVNGKDKTYINLTYIEHTADEDEAPPEEPGANG